ncbi:polyadenylate-binding protein 1 isoform X1 [Aegilops tauschii subsp. strangulata]|uniref:RRM domain-containing protein n=1 Tax=Aegilops tauschii subsp. strangulata TaxID=200361 RepID=A0A452YVF0_AEGTS|nr:polyadenylate-binding protein 1 isoform X1 [Aegilops tauschii subsp. strangulata]
MASGNRALPIENGEVLPAAGGNGEGGNGGSGDGFNRNRSSVDQQIDDMRRRLRELEETEREMLAVAAAASHEDPAAAATALEKAEVDACSIYVGNVDYGCLPEEVQEHFQDCGTVNRVTILTDFYGNPKGYAYVEFHEAEAVQNALQLNDTELHGRPLKVCPKRTNVPGMSYHRGRRPFQPYYPPYPAFGRSPRFYPYY